MSVVTVIKREHRCTDVSVAIKPKSTYLLTYVMKLNDRQHKF